MYRDIKYHNEKLRENIEDIFYDATLIRKYFNRQVDVLKEVEEILSMYRQ